VRIFISQSEAGNFSWVESASELVPPSCADFLLDKVIEHCISKEEDYFVSFSSLFNTKVRQIKIQNNSSDNSENLLTLLKDLSKCKSLQQIELSSEICKKIPKTLQDFVTNFPCSATVKSIKMSSCQYILPDPEMTLKFLETLEEANQLRELVIPGAAFDDLCFKHLLKLKHLYLLNINNCKFSTIQTVQLLTGLPKLKCLECTYGRQSKVVQALSTLHSSSKLSLTSLTYRQPPRPPFEHLNKLLPKLKSVKVVWNVFEAGYSSAIDQGLGQLHQLEGVTELTLEMSTINMLYVIQLGPKISSISSQITRIDLLEVEFLHPACLEHFGSLPNLGHLTIINPAIIGDDLFLELPELSPNPFPKIRKLTYEGQISSQLIDYFTKFSPELEELVLKCPNVVLEPKCLKNLHLEPKRMLRKLAVELTVATKGQIFIKEILKIIESSENLYELGNVGQWNNVLPAHLGQLESYLAEHNLDLAMEE